MNTIRMNHTYIYLILKIILIKKFHIGNLIKKIYKIMQFMITKIIEKKYYLLYYNK